jgi:hypothetical protein
MGTISGLFDAFDGTHATPPSAEDASGMREVPERLSLPLFPPVTLVTPRRIRRTQPYFLYETTRLPPPEDPATRVAMLYGATPRFSAKLIAVVDAESIEEAATLLGGSIGRPDIYAYKDVGPHCELFERRSLSAEFTAKGDLVASCMRYRVARPRPDHWFYHLGTNGLIKPMPRWPGT